jgi:hypothetical protein
MPGRRKALHVGRKHYWSAVMDAFDDKYRKIAVTDPGIDLPYFRFFSVDTLPFIKDCFLIFTISAIFLPFIPSWRTYRPEWTIPHSFAEYFIRVKNTMYLALAAVAFVVSAQLFSNLRTYFERKLGYKYVGIFKVKMVFYFLTRKLVMMNNLHFVILSIDDPEFQLVKIGDRFQIERSATYRLISYVKVES